MSLLREFGFRFGSFFRKRKLEDDMQEELGHHLALRAERNIAAGMSPEDARMHALRTFGGVEQIKERARDARGWMIFEQLWRDWRYALRQLVKTPIFTISAIVVLALGISATTAIFSVIEALLIAPLPYQDSNRLVLLQSRHKDQGTARLAPATFVDILAASKSFEGMAAQYPYYFSLTRIRSPVSVTGLFVTADYFRLFGVAPLLGRTWNSAETKSTGTPTVVLSYRLWKEQFGGSTDILYHTITIDDVVNTVIGVMPPTFNDPLLIHAALWRSIPDDGKERYNRDARYWTCLARLNPGVSLAQANTELSALARRLEKGYGDTYRGWTLTADDLRAAVVGDYHSNLLVVLAAVICVLLVTCANIAGLIAIRTTGRRKELAIRIALGASRRRVLGQLLVENLMVSLAGGILGVLLARWCIDSLLEFGAVDWLPHVNEIALNLPVLAAAFGLTLLTGVLCSLAPGFVASRTDANEALKENSHGAGGRDGRGLRSSLVVVELALALMLLVGTGLLGRSFLSILNKRPGIDGARVLSLTLSLSEKRYDTPEKCMQFYSRVLAEVAAVPGVESAGFIHTSPFRWGRPLTLVPVGSDGAVAASKFPQTFYDPVSIDYFRTVGTPLSAGRLFSEDDNAAARPVCILSESTARRFFGAENPLGRALTTDANNKLRLEIVGIVGDVRRSGLADEVPLQVYCPLSQRPPPFATLMARTELAPASLTKAIQGALWRIDPDTPLSDIAPMDTVISQSVARPKVYLVIFGAFAALALVLASIGLYALVAYGVAQRTREFGIRTALGACPQDLLTLVLREGAALVALGLGLGVLGAFATARILQSMIFETSVHDPVVFGIVSILLGVVAVTASYVPARRATKVDPLVALKCE
jgi:putative ABC transport system permease protein